MESFGNTGNEKQQKGGRFKQALKAAKPNLNLSAEQDQKIKEIFRNFREKKHAVTQAGGDNLNDNLQSVKKERKQQIMAVLNDEQKKILKDKLKELKGNVQ
jgi:hypothetical protein